MAIDELEFSEFEMSAFDNAEDFKKFLLELDEEYNITDVDEMVYYYKKRINDYEMFVTILQKFKNGKGI